MIIGTVGIMGRMAQEAANATSIPCSAPVLGAVAFVILMRGSLLSPGDELVRPALHDGGAE